MDAESGSSPMLMTVLEGHVTSEQWAAFADHVRTASTRLPPQMVQTLLVQSTADPTLWRMLSIWRSQEALGENRRAVDVPEGVLMFRAVGAEPQLSIFTVSANQRAGDGG